MICHAVAGSILSSGVRFKMNSSDSSFREFPNDELLSMAADEIIQFAMGHIGIFYC
jgi:hypothetical protein